MKILLTLLLLFSLSVTAQEIDFSTSTIGVDLKKNANSVVRFDKTLIEISSQKEMKISIKKAVTILNKYGDAHANVAVYYDKNSQIKELRTYAYDAFGKEIKKVKKNDFEDYAAVDGISLYNDSRLLYYRYVPISYPYTIYYHYEIVSSNTAFIRNWRPLAAYNQSVELSSFKITHPQDIKLKTLEHNFDQYQVKKNNTVGNIDFSLKNLIGFKNEYMSPALDQITPLAQFGLNKFHLEGVYGVAETWDDFGKWMYHSLIKASMDLPLSTKEMIKRKVEGIEDPIERAKIVYEFVQNKTRYISVQVGIGGWKPMLASEVDKLSYGDCKALTNYTKTLMDAAGVESYYTAVYGGSRKDINEDIISIQGNHVILYIPNDKQDVWLECTSQDVPFGYQGTFTDNRDVLVIKPDGGMFKNTGVLSAHDNYLKTSANFQVNKDGLLTGKVKIQSYGTQYDDHYQLGKKPDREVKIYYKDNYWPYINNLDIQSYTFNNDRDSISFTENIALKAPNFASVSGERIFFSINPFNRYTNVPKRYQNRKLPFEIEHGFFDEDSFNIEFADSYKIEALSAGIKLENKFGTYKVVIKKLENNTIHYTRSLLINKGKYEAIDYAEYRKFIRKIIKNDQSKISLIR